MVFDYAMPLNTEAPAVEDEPAQQALDEFGQARAAFLAGNYDGALKLADAALVKTPQDAAIHEFRSLTLFALGRFDEAAAVIYPVLSVGPGWSWETLVGLYPNVDVYTQQLRALETYRVKNDQDAAPAFLLAYHYLTMGHKKNAQAQLEAVVKLQPDDRLAQQLLKSLSGKPADAAEALAAPPAIEQPAATAKQFPLAGSWSAQASPEASITLEVKDDGSFSWVYSQDGKPRTIAGTSTIGATGLLTLASSNAGVMVGQVQWTDADHFNFKLSGGGKDDEGLNFTRMR